MWATEDAGRRRFAGASGMAGVSVRGSQGRMWLTVSAPLADHAVTLYGRLIQGSRPAPDAGPAPGGDPCAAPQLARAAPELVAGAVPLERPAVERELVELLVRQPVAPAEVATARLQVTEELHEPGAAVRAVLQLPLNCGPRTLACYVHAFILWQLLAEPVPGKTPRRSRMLEGRYSDRSADLSLTHI
jgi:hypothetical protein